MPTIFEPFRIKSVEALPRTSPHERMDALADAHFNTFMVAAAHVTFDFLTDSGTTAMSDRQWAAMMQGDESYAGSRSYTKFRDLVTSLTGYRHVIPTHQGRAAERILVQIAAERGQRVPNNSHFDTTRANLEFQGVHADDFVVAESRDPRSEFPFKGNIDVPRLEKYLDEQGANVAFGMITITNNTGGGQPASLENIRQVSRAYKRRRIPFFLDACRFAENAYMIQQREEGQSGRSVRSIAQEIFALADGCTLSGKKDALVNMGGFLALNDDGLAGRARNLLILTEGFPTYGGCAARDLEAMTVGLVEVLDHRYLEYRTATIRYFADGLESHGIPTVRPPGGHAVYVDARAFLPHIPSHEFPGQSLVVAMYLEAGVRACEIGSVMFGKEGDDGEFVPADLELVRLALPRRRYTQSHIDHVIERCGDLAERRDRIGGMRMSTRPPFLPHFTAHFEPIGDWVTAEYANGRTPIS